MVTITQLNCFLAVARNLSFVRASKELFVSQPAVSHHINMLEEELGTPLLIRDKHHVALTDAGERFYLEVADVMNQLDGAIEFIQRTPELPEVLHIGFENTVEIHKLPEIFTEYTKKKPNVRFYCHGFELAEAIKQFNGNKLDILFTTCSTIKSSDEKFYPLFNGRFCCVMKKDDPLAAKSLISPEDLEERTLIFAEKRNCAPEMANLQRTLHMRFPNMKVHFSSSIHYSIAMIEAGIGIVILPDFLFSPHQLLGGKLVSIPFDTDTPAQVGIMGHKNFVAEKTKLFISMTRSFYSDQTDCVNMRKRKRELIYDEAAE